MLGFDICEYSSWERIKRSGLPVVIYGMGNGADKVLDEFEKLEVPVKGVTAGDEFVRGQSFRGFTVKKLREFSGDFILAVAFGSGRPEVIEHIKELSNNYNVIFPVVPVYGNEIFNRELLEKNKNEISLAYNCFGEKSKEIFGGCINFIFGGDLKDLLKITTSKNEIFESFLHLGSKESYLDLGAYKGDTVEEFLKYTGGSYNRIIAVEPDEKNYKKLVENCNCLKNFTPVNKAISGSTGEVLFSESAGRNSSVSSKGKARECVSVDDLCGEETITYLKADVEGEEMNMFRGAGNTIVRCRPKLNIALYHRSADIFRIPLAVKKLNPDYLLEIRHHPYFPCWDTNLYAVDKNLI